MTTVVVATLGIATDIVVLRQQYIELFPQEPARNLFLINALRIDHTRNHQFLEKNLSGIAQFMLVCTLNTISSLTFSSE